jgi:hypothetical protein
MIQTCASPAVSRLQDHDRAEAYVSIQLAITDSSLLREGINHANSVFGTGVASL